MLVVAVLQVVEAALLLGLVVEGVLDVQGVLVLLRVLVVEGVLGVAVLLVVEGALVVGLSGA